MKDQHPLYHKSDLCHGNKQACKQIDYQHKALCKWNAEISVNKMTYISEYEDAIENDEHFSKS